MRPFAPLTLLGVLAACAAVPWMAAAAADRTFGGHGPGNEVEPNDRLSNADVLGQMPADEPLAVWGEIVHKHDLDTYRVEIRMPTSLDVRVLTGAASLPIAGSGASGGIYTPSFIPVLRVYGPDGRLVFMEISDAPNMLLLDLEVPLFNQCFFLELSALPGSYGPYALQVEVH
jgi:hypothetical protein